MSTSRLRTRRGQDVEDLQGHARLMSRPLVAATALLLAVVSAGSAAPSAAAAPTSSTTLTLSLVQSAYGQTVTASAQVVTASGQPQGDVVFSVDALRIKANLGGGGTATAVLPKALVGAHAVAATFVPQFPAEQGASTSPTVDWLVQQVRTRLQVQVTGRRTKVPTTVRAQAGGEFGTTPTGRLKVVLRRAGAARSTRVVQTLSTTGLAVADLRRLRPGAYRAVVTYVGDSQHLRQRRVERFRVRP